MRGVLPTLFGTAITSGVVVAGFIVTALFMVRWARNPKTVARDAIEHKSLPLIRNPTHREKVFFFVGVVVAASAPWITYLLER